MIAQRLARIPQHVLVGAVAALATAALHLVTVTFTREELGEFTWSWYGRDVIWMVPLGYVTVFSLISIPLGLLAALLPHGVGIRATAWLWSTLASFSVLLLFPRVLSVAWLVVAIGIGAQASRLLARRPDATKRAVGRAGIALAAVFVAMTLLSEGPGAYRAHRAIDSRPAASPNAPNILLLVWDTVRAKNISLYGHARRTTPFLDSLARHAIVFDRAFATASWTLPSHASMFTGQYATRTNAERESPLDRTHRTLAEELRDHGYVTAGFVANLKFTTRNTGLHRGFTHYEDTRRTLREVILHTTLTQSTAVQRAYTLISRDSWYGEAARALLRFDWRPDTPKFQKRVFKSGTDVTSDFLRWQARTPEPFFVFLNYMEAHDPQLAPDQARFNAGKTRLDRYDGALYSLDRELERVVSELDRRGVLARTTIVLTSDHGEQFGEHDLIDHGNSLYAQVLHVPLVIYVPHLRDSGLHVSRVVSLRDLSRTILALAGITNSSLPGTMIMPPNPTSAAVLPASPAIAELRSLMGADFDDMTAAIDDSLHVIREGSADHSVFAYPKDIDEVDDLARDPRIAQWARSRIDSLVLQFGLRQPVTQRTRRQATR
jgi:arylsulfatase A-like enzyme